MAAEARPMSPCDGDETMNLIRLADLPQSPWRNGGGVTREIARGPAGGAPVWRLSRADVARDGPFSAFPGMTRILTVVEGAGLSLTGPWGRLDALRWRPVRFDGGLEVSARLTSGPVSPLNLMFDSRFCAADVRLSTGPQRRDLTPTGGRRFAVHCLLGEVALGGGDRLGPGDTALMADERRRLTLGTDGAALLVTLDLPPQIDASSPRIAPR